MPSSRPRAASSRSSSDSAAITSPSRSIAGLLASSWITLPSAAVIVISGPSGVAPCDTQGRTSTPERYAPTAPALKTSPSHISRLLPPKAALESPPITGVPGRVRSSALSRTSEGKL